MLIKLFLFFFFHPTTFFVRLLFVFLCSIPYIYDLHTKFIKMRHNQSTSTTSNIQHQQQQQQVLLNTSRYNCSSGHTLHAFTVPIH